MKRKEKIIFTNDYVTLALVMNFSSVYMMSLFLVVPHPSERHLQVNSFSKW